MALQSIFWTTNGTGDGAAAYTQAQVTEWLRKFLLADPAGEGVIPGVGGDLAVTGTSSPVAVAAGAALVYGFPAWSSASENVTVPTPVIGTTGHRIVLRANWSAQTVRVERISSSDGVAAFPALTQTAGTTWEISLATLTITTGGIITVTDARQYAHFNTKLSGANLDSASVPAAKLASGAALANLDNGSVTAAKLASGAAVGNLGYTPWHAGNDGAGSGLDADLLDGFQASQFWRPDNDGDGSGLDADKLAGVDVAPIQRRGGNASNWNVGGTTNYSPAAVRMQTGVHIHTGGVTNTVTFPVAFSAPPVVVACTDNPASPIGVDAGSTTASGFTYVMSGTIGAQRISWIAVGPT